MSRQSSAKTSASETNRITSSKTNPVDVNKVDLVIADVPCRFYSPTKNLRGRKYPLMVKRILSIRTFLRFTQIY